MANEPKSQPWWKTTNPQTLDDRVQAVQNVNDPTIMSDDVLRWSKVALYALLLFTTILSGFSYFKFFEHSFGPNIAAAMAILLACIIEFGKNWGGLRVLRIPFFHGWGHIYSTVSATIMWAGLLALAVVTFSASVYNSTKGAEQLSLLLGHEKNRTVFEPNTADIDAQIAATEKRIEENRAVKWKGTTTVDAQRTIKAESRNLNSLQAQRETRIQQQRADYEKESGIKDSQNQFTAGSLLAVGGWVELLQVILMFVRVSAERSLDKTGAARRTTTPPPPNSNGQTTQNGAYKVAQNKAGSIGFYWDGYGSPSPQPLFDPKTVPQSPTTVAQQKEPGNRDVQDERQKIVDQITADYADSVLKVCKDAVQRDLSNFQNRQASQATVSRRINTALDECRQAMMKTGFEPTYRRSLEMHAFVQDKVWPTLNTVGWPYDHEKFFMQWLVHRMNEAKAREKQVPA
jgi:hypothetical protein